METEKLAELKEEIKEALKRVNTQIADINEIIKKLEIDNKKYEYLNYDGGWTDESHLNYPDDYKIGFKELNYCMGPTKIYISKTASGYDMIWREKV
jgi:hypothetical protein